MLAVVAVLFVLLVCIAGKVDGWCDLGRAAGSIMDDAFSLLATRAMVDLT
jgi:hypothetical protein